MNCSKCNAPLMEGDLFCPICGEPVAQKPHTEPAPQPMPPQQPVYNPVYTNQPVMKKSNGGMIVAIVLAVVAIIAAIIAIVALAMDSSDNDSESLPTEIVYQAPVFDYVVGSSTRSYDVDSTTNQRVYYYEDYAMDNDMTTAWTPNRNTDPVPSITLRANEKQYVSGIKMTNGYCKSEKTYTKNRRIAKVRITYSGGETIAEFGTNHYREMIDIPFGKTVETDYISIHILDAYYGEWNDIAISEIDVY